MNKDLRTRIPASKHEIVVTYIRFHGKRTQLVMVSTAYTLVPRTFLCPSPNITPICSVLKKSTFLVYRAWRHAKSKVRLTGNTQGSAKYHTRFVEIEYVYEQKAVSHTTDTHFSLTIDFGLHNLTSCIDTIRWPRFYSTRNPSKAASVGTTS